MNLSFSPSFRDRVKNPAHGSEGIIQVLSIHRLGGPRFNEEKPLIRSYIFTITLIPKSEGKTATFAINADPEQSQGVTTTGRNFYYTDATGGICINKERRATADDEIL